MDKSLLKQALATANSKPVMKAEGNTLTLIGSIGSWWDELDAKTVVDLIDSIEGDITVRLNSPGGDVFDGLTIMNALKQHDGKVTVVVEGLAASAASYIAIGAADELKMADGAMLMIHNALSIAVGNAADFRKEADLLDKISADIASIYVKRCGKTMDEVKASMDAETWFTAQEAKDYGFNVIMEDEEARIENFAMLATYNHVPTKFNNVPAFQSDTSRKRSLEAELHNLGYSRKEARAIVSKVASVQCDAGTDDSAMLAELERAISDRRNIFK